jgi:hypothetical protein
MDTQTTPERERETALETTAAESGSTASAGSETREVFTPQQVEHAIQTWLGYGEDSYVEAKEPGEPGHRGYFSGSGWAARCLRFHLEELRRAAESPNGESSDSAGGRK